MKKKSVPFLPSALSGASAVMLLISVSACSGVQGGDAAEAEGKFPSRAVELTVPYDAGGSSDLIARALAQDIQAELGQPMVVVNKPGGGGVVGARDALGAAPNGYSIAELSKSQFTISPLVESEDNVLDLNQLRIVAGLTTEEYALVVNADSEYETLDDLLKTDKKLTFGHSGVGTGTHFAQEVLFSSAGIEANDVPFDGSSPSITALLGDQVDVSAGNIAEVMSQIEAGKLRPLATFSAERSEFLPDVPTAEEAGYDIVLDQRRFIAAPADTPDEIVNALDDSFDAIEESQEYKEFLDDNYIAFWGADAEETKQHLEDERAAIETATKDLGIDFGQEG